MEHPNTYAASLKSDEKFFQYIRQRKWAQDQNTDRKMYLFRVARNSAEQPDIAAKVGGILIYNQVIEQFLADIIEMSIYYIKASVLPVSVDLTVELDKATFGKMIEYFRQYAIAEVNQEQILHRLKKFNTKRNQVAHDLFDVADLELLSQELSDYGNLANEIIFMLDEYDNLVCKKFCELEKQRNFQSL